MMNAIMILTVIFTGIVLTLAVIGGTFLLAIKIIKGGGVSRRDRNLQTEEARMIQEIYHGLSEMEKRVEVLETILMERFGKER